MPMVPEAQVAATLLVSSFRSEFINFLIPASDSTCSLNFATARLQGLVHEPLDEGLRYNDITIKLIMINPGVLG